jgi:hypothetical protein
MKKLPLLIALTLFCSSCAPSTTLRAFFTGRPSNAQTVSLLETVINRSGGAIQTCPADLLADRDPRYNHLCGRMPGDFGAFQAAFEGNLIKTANETGGSVDRLYDGWKRSNNFVYVGFFSLSSREFSVAFGPNPDGRSGSVVIQIDQLDR